MIEDRFSPAGSNEKMMKFLNFVYVSFYAASFENLPFERKNMASFYIAAIFGISIGGWLTTLLGVIFLLTTDNKTPPHLTYFILLFMAIGYGLTNWYYTKDERYMQLYKDYKAQNKVMTRTKALILMSAFMIIPYLVLIIISIQ